MQHDSNSIAVRSKRSDFHIMRTNFEFAFECYGKTIARCVAKWGLGPPLLVTEKTCRDMRAKTALHRAPDNARWDCNTLAVSDRSSDCTSESQSRGQSRDLVDNRFSNCLTQNRITVKQSSSHRASTSNNPKSFQLFFAKIRTKPFRAFLNETCPATAIWRMSLISFGASMNGQKRSWKFLYTQVLPKLRSRCLLSPACRMPCLIRSLPHVLRA